MNKRSFSTSPHYLQSIRGLHELHKLTIAGLDESPEADMVRDQLEVPWRLLSETEQRRIGGLSADLYSISEPIKNALPMNPQVQRNLNEFDKAIQEEEWDRALNLLRRWQRYIDPAELSYKRGRVWFEAGDYATAENFLRHAVKLAPRNGEYGEWFQRALGRTNPAEALAHAKEVVFTDESRVTRRVFQSAVINIVSIGCRVLDDLELVRTLIPILEEAIRKMRPGELKFMNSVDVYNMLHYIAYSCYKETGDSNAALDCVNRGLLVYPNDEFLLVGRGFLRYGLDPSALEDFQHVIRAGTNSALPYYCLAHYDLTHRRFQQCAETCECAIKLDAPPLLKAHLNAWLGISRAELGFPEFSVRAAFEDALRYGVDSESILRNYEMYKRELSGQADQAHEWTVPRESEMWDCVPTESLLPKNAA